MPLASSGLISLGGTDPLRSANLAAGQAATATITMPSSVTRTLTGVASGPIILPNNFWGKPAGFTTVSLASISAGTPFAAESFGVGEPATAELVFEPNGTWNFYGEEQGNRSGNWATPTTTGGGAGYWIQWTRTAYFGGPGNSATPTSGWQQLSTGQYITVINSGSVANVSAQYNINIATDSGGANVIATASFITVNAFTNI